MNWVRVLRVVSLGSKVSEMLQRSRRLEKIYVVEEIRFGIRIGLECVHGFYMCRDLEGRMEMLGGR